MVEGLRRAAAVAVLRGAAAARAAAGGDDGEDVQRQQLRSQRAPCPARAPQDQERSHVVYLAYTDTVTGMVPRWSLTARHVIGAATICNGIVFTCSMVVYGDTLDSILRLCTARAQSQSRVGVLCVEVT